MKKGKDKDKITENEAALWRRAMRNTKSYVSEEKEDLPSALSKKSKAVLKDPPTPDTRPRAKTLQTGIKKTPVPVQAPEKAGFDRATETRLKKGKLPIEGRIDLHGMTQEEAHRALHRFVTSSRKTGRRTVLVITGKGKAGGGILRRMLPLWLEDPALKKLIVAITPAQPKDGGDGAFYLRLRKLQAD